LKRLQNHEWIVADVDPAAIQNVIAPWMTCILQIYENDCKLRILVLPDFGHAGACVFTRKKVKN
jgi:hypothetical protein